MTSHDKPDKLCHFDQILTSHVLDTVICEDLFGVGPSEKFSLKGALGKHEHAYPWYVIDTEWSFYIFFRVHFCPLQHTNQFATMSQLILKQILTTW